MASRNGRHIQTGRAQLFVDVTTHERPGEGNVLLTGGAAGSVDGITVDGVEIMSGSVPFNTSLAQTAIDVADNINNNITSPNYHARAVGDRIYIWQQTISAATLTVVSSTTTITTTDTDVSGGVIGNGTPLGYTEEGFDLSINDEKLEEPTEESGVENIKSFHIGQNVEITAIFKQWDSDVLALRHPGQHTTTGDVNRVEIPGDLVAGDDMDPYYKVFELRPDNKKYPTLLIRRGLAIGDAGEPTRFRTQEIKKVGVNLKCYRDESHVATNYATVGIDLAQNLTL